MTCVDFVSDPPEVWDSFAGYTGALAFDVGANGGMTARIFADRFEQVVAFEPCRESFSVLVGDCPPNVTPVPVAIADRTGPVVLEETATVTGMGELKLGDSMERIWGATTGTRTVPALTLDLAAEMFGQPDFVKIDTEGSEWLIVQGADRVFERRPSFVIEVHSEANGDRIRERFAGLYQSLTVVRHPAYPEGSPLFLNHYYLVGEA